MARILVTGGAGFIGSHLCEYLLNKEHEVVCVDNFYTGARRNIIHLLDNKEFQLIDHDTVNPLFLEVDQIYNLACPASPIHYQHNPIKTIKMGTVAMVNMLGIAKRTQARILQASTSEVYGDPLVHPQPESYWGNVNPLGPRACYDEGKRVAESLMVSYHRQAQVDIRIARIFNTYGPRMSRDDGRVVSNFITQALEGKPLTIYGEGGQTRSFCYIDDMIDGLVSLMGNESETCHMPVNLGNPHEISILQLAEHIKELTGSGIELVFESLPQDDPVRRMPDITRAKELLGWEPKIDLKEGLQKTIDYFKGTS